MSTTPLSPAVRTDLLNAAQAARSQAYAPYSGYHVGAAVVAQDGRIFSGANVENVAYPLCVCAERNAIMAAVLAGARRMVAMAVVTVATPPASPCGGCRQVLAEFAADEVPVLLANAAGEVIETTLGALFPRPFRMDAPR